VTFQIFSSDSRWRLTLNWSSTGHSLAITGLQLLLLQLRSVQFRLFWDRWSVDLNVLLVGPRLGLMIRFLLLPNICGLHVLGRPTWREDGSVIFSNRPISGPSPAELMTSCCLIADYWVPILPLVTTRRYSNPPPYGVLTSYLLTSSNEVEVATDGQSASLSWCWAPIWNSWPDLFLSNNCGYSSII
jgi:hypothetical protein